jgi:MYXO-CTERM domain-containing protein
MPRPSASLPALLAPLAVAAAPAARADEVVVLELDLGSVDPAAAWARLPFEVPAGTAELELRRASATEGVVVDLGLLEPGGALRGWSGGNAEPAVVGVEAASRSYRAGPLPEGAWHALVGLPGLPEGPVSVRLEVELRAAPTLAPEPDRAPYAPPAPLRRGRAWVAGDFHVHSRESGDADPAADLDAVAEAARAAGLDFVLLSEHNTDAHLQLLAAAQARHPDLLLLPGVEWTSHRGHALVPGATSPPPFWVGLDGLTAADAAADAAAQGALFAPAHPALDLGALCLGCAWTHELPPEAIDALEVATLDVELVGTFLFDGAVGLWDELCDQGRHVVPLGGSDDHAAGQGEGPFSSPVGRPRTLVEVDELSVEGLLAGLRAGRTVVQLGGEGDPMVVLEAEGRVGDTIEAAAATLTVEVTGGAGGELQWWVDGALAAAAPVDADPWTGAHELVAPAAGEARARALLVRDGLPRTVTSHLWLRRPADSGAPGAADPGAKAGGCGCAAGAGPLAAGLWGLIAALIAAARRRR